MNRMAVKIKEARVKANMSEKDLAKACGQNVNYILQIESGKKVINEQIAENILKILGEKVEFFADIDTSEKEKTPLIKPSVKVSSEKPTVQTNRTEAITPNEEWQGALAGVIKSYPIQEEKSGKIVGYKDIPIMTKKVDGHHYEKVSFIKVTETDLLKHRILKGDTIMISSTTEIQNQGLYYIEVNQNKMIRQLEIGRAHV